MDSHNPPAAANNNSQSDSGVSVPVARTTPQPAIQTRDEASQITPSGGHKEAEPVAKPELTQLVELQKDHELEPEVEGWIEKLEKAQDVHLQQPVMHEEQVLVAQPTAQIVDDQIVLPLSFNQVQKGLKSKTTDSVRWLAEWCLRVAKMFGDRVVYRGD